MAQIDLGSIKFNWKGTYSGATAYVVDDVVESSGSSYICIAASTGNAPPNATYWELMSQKGTDGTNGTDGADGTDLTTTLTAQGDILYRDGSGLARLAAGTSGQALLTQGTGANPQWGNVSSAVINMEKIYYSNSNVTFTNQSGTNLSGNTYYPNSGKISGTYNKQQSSSHILMQVHYSLGHSPTNIHGACAWRTGKEAYFRNTGFDARIFGWYHHGSNGAFVMTDQIWFDGSTANDVQGTGNMTFNYAGAVDGTRTHSHELNFNPHSNTYGAVNTDTPNKNTFSQITIIEYEA